MTSGPIHHPVARHAAGQGERLAVDEGDRRITYAGLHAAAEQAAGLLAESGAGRGDRVGIFLDNGIEACVGILAALRVGACYVPLAPSFPPARVAGIVADAGIRVLFSATSQLGRLAAVAEEPAAAGLRRAWILDGQPPEHGGRLSDLLRADHVAPRPPPPPDLSGPDDLCYVMYTSGTTGKPKGVMLRHRNVAAFLDWAAGEFAFAPSDRLSGHSRIGFDLSVLDMFGAFRAGAAYCPLTRAGDLSFPGRFIREMGLTVWFSVPGVIATLKRSGQLGALGPSLRLALFCGEALPLESARAWHEARPDVPLYNLYGPTEAAIACTWHRFVPADMDRSGGSVPIGRPCGDTGILVLREDADAPAAPGEPGRLMILGPQLAAGYRGRDDLTAAAFRPAPGGGQMYDSGDLARRDADGTLHWLCRRDQQVKIQGYRVETAEIEGALLACPGVQEAAVVVLEGDPPVLAAGLVLAGAWDAKTGPARLREHCARTLPAYMVPRRFLALEALPRNANGKADRRALAARLSETR